MFRFLRKVAVRGIIKFGIEWRRAQVDAGVIDR